jgi:hypothetical protein
MFGLIYLFGLLLVTGWILKYFAYTPFPAPVAAPSLAPTTPTSPTTDPRAYVPESWCFVGENTLGRYCIKSEKCGPLDRFPSREACELTEASALPLGVTKDGGLVYNPFMQPKAARYHTF